MSPVSGVSTESSFFYTYLGEKIFVKCMLFALGPVCQTIDQPLPNIGTNSRCPPFSIASLCRTADKLPTPTARTLRCHGSRLANIVDALENRRHRHNKYATSMDPKIITTVQPVFLDYPGVARLLNVSSSTVQKMVREGDLPRPRRISARRVGFLVRELVEWVEARPVSELPPPVNCEYGRPGKLSTKEIRQNKRVAIEQVGETTVAEPVRRRLAVGVRKP